MNLTPSAVAAIAASSAQLDELETAGLRAIARDGYHRLALQASDLHSVLYLLQSDGSREARRIDIDALEDLCVLLQALAAEQARLV